MKNVVILYLLAIFLCSCEKESNPLTVSKQNEFSIFLLNDSTITIEKALKMDLTQLELKDKSWLSSNAIKYYDFSSHNIYLNVYKDSLFPILDKQLFPESWWNKPFVVIAGGENRYLGVFHGGLSLNNWPLPYIEDYENTIRYPKDIINISWIYLFQTQADKRNDPNVKESLRKLSIYHAGIEVSIDSINITRTFDSSTVTYTISITNNDENDLYLPDPDLMGSALFHFYNNGPVFINSTLTEIYKSNLKTVVRPTPFDSWNPEWFVRLQSKATIKRVISLSGYPSIPSGVYNCEFRYCGPVNIEKTKRTLNDGRYWIGPSVSNINNVKL